MSYYVATIAYANLCFTPRQKQHFCCLLESCSTSATRFTFGRSRLRTSIQIGGILLHGVSLHEKSIIGMMGTFMDSASSKRIPEVTGSITIFSSIDVCRFISLGGSVNHWEFFGFTFLSFQLPMELLNISPSILERTSLANCTAFTDGVHSAVFGPCAKMQTLLSTLITCEPAGVTLRTKSLSAMKRYCAEFMNSMGVVAYANASRSFGLVNLCRLLVWCRLMLRLHRKVAYGITTPLGIRERRFVFVPSSPDA